MKANEFIRLLEGAALPARRQAHLAACASCRTALESHKAIQSGVAGMADPADAIPEPDWAEFRHGVRDALLSRSAQRSATLRGWFGQPANAVVAWGVTVMLAIIVTAGVFFWNGWEPPAEAPARQAGGQTSGQANGPDGPTGPNGPNAPFGLSAVAETGGLPLSDDVHVWTSSSVFDDIARLNDGETEQLRLLLEGAFGGGPALPNPANQ